MKITLAQVLALFVVASSIFAIFRESQLGEIVWLDQTLKYKSPTIPDQFQNNGRQPPYSTLTGSLIEVNMDEWGNGQSYFLASHRRGWERCRSRFIHGKPIQAIDQMTLAQLPNDNWENHASYAFDEGYNACAKQIDDSLDSYSATELKNRICYWRAWHMVPLVLILLVSVVAFTFQFQRRTPIDQAKNVGTTKV